MGSTVQSATGSDQRRTSRLPGAKLFGAAAAVVVFAGASGLQAGSSPALAQDLAAGEKLARTMCSRCHAVGRDDKSRLPIAPAFRELAKRYSVWGLQEALAEGVVVGHPAMPKFVFTPQEIFNLLSYMETLGPDRSKSKKK